METLTAYQIFLLFFGVVVGVIAVVLGGSMFFSTPVFQLCFPDATTGQIVGNIKMASMIRGAASTLETRRQIDARYCLKRSAPYLVGAILGARYISTIPQFALLPLIILGILISENVHRLNAVKATGPVLILLSFATGLYGGVIGIGIGLILTALVRLDAPDECRIAWSKIQARALEFLIALVAVVTHFLKNNIVFEMWFYFGIGSFAGGILGGRLLQFMQHLSGRAQKAILVCSYFWALATAAFAAAKS